MTALIHSQAVSCAGALGLTLACLAARAETYAGGTSPFKVTRGGGEIMTNEKVITLSKAGVPEDIIMDMVESASRSKFDMTEKGILQLQAASVNPDVIRAMRKIYKEEIRKHDRIIRNHHVPRYAGEYYREEPQHERQRANLSNDFHGASLDQQNRESSSNVAGHLLTAVAREARGCCESGGLAGYTLILFRINCLLREGYMPIPQEKECNARSERPEHDAQARDYSQHGIYAHETPRPTGHNNV